MKMRCLQPTPTFWNIIFKICEQNNYFFYFSPWYSWTFSHLKLNNNHSFNPDYCFWRIMYIIYTSLLHRHSRLTLSTIARNMRISSDMWYFFSFYCATLFIRIVFFCNVPPDWDFFNVYSYLAVTSGCVFQSRFCCTRI
jgi:hypothetical protein